MASGMPSSRSTDLRNRIGRISRKALRDSAERARRNRSTAASRSSERTRHTCSSATPRLSRLVARTFTVADCPSMASSRSAAASSMCSQLSNTSSRRLPSSAAATVSAQNLARLLGDAKHRSDRIGNRCRIGHVPPVRKAIPRPVNSSCNVEATSSASRVLPTPPTPVRVTRRCARSARSISATSASRPMNAARRRAQVARAGVEHSQRRKLLTQTRRPHLKQADRARHIAQSSRPEIE